ncbi:MAG: BF3164 family lipoprotein [Parabacteroides merdae]
MVATQEISIDSAFFRYPYRVAVKDSIAIIMDLHNDSHYFYAFTVSGVEADRTVRKAWRGPGNAFGRCSSFLH